MCPPVLLTADDADEGTTPHVERRWNFGNCHLRWMELDSFPIESPSSGKQKKTTFTHRYKA